MQPFKEMPAEATELHGNVEIIRVFLRIPWAVSILGIFLLVPCVEMIGGIPKVVFEASGIDKDSCHFGFN